MHATIDAFNVTIFRQAVGLEANHASADTLTSLIKQPWLEAVLRLQANEESGSTPSP